MVESSISDSHVVVVGGGITGLAAAYFVQKAASESTRRISYTLIESSDRLGGKVLTDTVETDDGTFVVEAGPDSFISQKPWAFELAAELGIAERVEGTNDASRKVYVLNKGRPTLLPEGVLLIVPTKFTPFALSPLISPLGKIRMGMELFIPAKQDDEDETLAEFITRRLGDEALDKIAEPLMSGIYNAEADKQSLMATFPRFRAMEQKYGSLIKGMLASKKARASRKPAPQNGGPPKPKSAFVTLHDGTQELTDKLAETLTGDVRTGQTVASVERREDGRYTVNIQGDTQPLIADYVILTTPAYASADIVRNISPDTAEILDSIRYVSTGTVSLAYPVENLDGVIDGFGLVIPISEKRPINAVTFSSTKFSNRAPDGYRLMRVFFGGSRSPQSMDLSDDELISAVLAQLNELLGIDAPPLFHRIYRWSASNPQYDVGHLERVDTIERQLPAGIAVAGSPYRGVGLPDCVHQAQLAVEKLLQEEASSPVASNVQELRNQEG